MQTKCPHNFFVDTWQDGLVRTLTILVTARQLKVSIFTAENQMGGEHIPPPISLTNYWSYAALA